MSRPAVSRTRLPLHSQPGGRVRVVLDLSALARAAQERRREQR